MKLKVSKLFFGAIIFQVLATQGVLFFILFKYLGNWELKKYLHPISFFLVITFFIIKSVKKISFTFLDICFFFYFSFIFIIMLYNVGSLESAYISFREIFFIFILVFIFSKIEIESKNWIKILNLILILIVLNTFFIFLTNYLGPDKYMILITDRYQWGLDEEYKFKISNFYKFWRSPALIGDAASVGYFSIIGYLLMDKKEKYKKSKYIALIPLFFSFVRSAYLVFIVYEFLKFFTKKKNLKILVLILKISIPILLIFLYFISKSDILSTASLLDRFYLWSNKINVDFNYLFGGAAGNIGGAVIGQGFIATIDSYWFFLFLSSGLFGVLLALSFFYEKSLKDNKSIFVLVSFFLSGFFVSFSQSLVILALFPLFFVRVRENNTNYNEDSI